MGLGGGPAMNELGRLLSRSGVSHLFFPETNFFASSAAKRGSRSKPDGKQSPPPVEPSFQKSSTTPEIPSALCRFLSPAPILWTYFEFPWDIFTSGIPERQELVRNLFTSLSQKESWPKGSSTFWPVTRIDNDCLTPDSNLFFAGTRQISPLYIFCLGEHTISALCGDRETFMHPFTYCDLRIQPLPSLESMLEGPKEERQKNKKKAWEIIRGYTRFIL